MIRFYFMLLVANILCFPGAFAQTDTTANTKRFSLEGSLDYAMENQTDLHNAALERKVAKADIGATRAQGLPQINGSVEFTNNFAVPTTFLPASALGAFGGSGSGSGGGGNGDEEAVELRFGIRNQASASLSASQMIFDGSYFVGLQAARVYAELSRKDYEQTKVNITEAVTKAYYTALINQERTALLEKNVARLDTLLRETRIMQENGFAEKMDVNRIQVQYNNIKVEQNKTERMLEVSHMLLKFQMGMPVKQDITLSGNIEEIDFDYEMPNEGDFNYNNRLDYSKLQTNQELAQLDLKNNRIKYIPQLDARANFGYNIGRDYVDQMTNLNNWNELGSWSLTLSVPIFDGLLKHNRIQKNKLQIQQLKNQEKMLQNSIDLEIKRARVNLQNSLESLEAQNENLSLAEDVYNDAKIKYQEGVGSNLEVVEAETDYKESETNYYSALYDALIAKVELQKALGILVDEN